MGDMTQFEEEVQTVDGPGTCFREMREELKEKSLLDTFKSI